MHVPVVTTDQGLSCELGSEVSFLAREALTPVFPARDVLTPVFIVRGVLTPVFIARAVLTLMLTALDLRLQSCQQEM